MLRATAGDQVLRLKPLTRIGSGAGNDIVLDAAGILQHHASIVQAEGQEILISACDDDTVDGRALIAGMRVLSGIGNRLRLGGEPLVLERVTGPRVEEYDPARHTQEACAVCGKRFQPGNAVVFCYSCGAVAHHQFCVESTEKCFRCQARQE